MNPKLTLALVLLVFALADARNTNINVTSTIRLEPSDDPLTPAAQELLAAQPVLNNVCGSSSLYNTECYPFVITVKTGDKAFDRTDVRVYIIMYGSGGKKNVEKTSGKIWLEGRVKDEMNKTDVFNVEVDKMISPISKIAIGIDNSGFGPGCFFGICNEISWQVKVMTSDLRKAGTNAKVFIRIYGDKGTSEDIRLDNDEDNFERGKTDTFRFTTPDLGKIYKMRVWHDNTKAYAGWHLNKIELLRLETEDKYIFNCGRWLVGDELAIEIPA